MTDPDDSHAPEQLALIREAVRPVKAPDATALAPERPVARVAVDVSLAHLDRPFDYLVPADLDERAVPGARVVVRFAGKQVSGFVLERVESSDHTGRLGRLGRVVSDEVVLRPDVARLVRQVADRYAGTFADVLRLAVPPRHGRAESKAPPKPPEHDLAPAEVGGWADYTGGTEYVTSLAAGRSPRACVTSPPGSAAFTDIAGAVHAALASGRGAVVCAPDVKDVKALDAALTGTLGAGRHVILTADLGPSARYTAFLALARGQVKVVVGTRAAAFAPVHDLGLVVTWDDGDDLLAEQRAPYAHAREVLLTRAFDVGCAVLLAGHARSVEAQQLVESGWCAEIGARIDVRRAQWARVAVTGADDRAIERDQSSGRARLSHEVFEVVRDALTRGPVLVQVPRLGYSASLACQTCRSPARCRECSGPLTQRSADAVPTCRWCGRDDRAWRCEHCGSALLRAPVVGDQRTAEELGRAFPQTPVLRSSGDHVLTEVRAEPALVVATPGAEPVTPGGYAGALLMDTWLLLVRPDLRASEEALRRWLNAVSLVRPADDGGRVVAVGDPSTDALQALVRIDPAGFARRQLAERVATRLPPAVRLASIEADQETLEALAEHDWPEPADVMGPVSLDDLGEGSAPRRAVDGAPDRSSRLIVRVPKHRGSALARELTRVQSTRSAHKLVPLRIDMDPAHLT